MLEIRKAERTKQVLSVPCHDKSKIFGVTDERKEIREMMTHLSKMKLYIIQQLFIYRLAYMIREDVST